MNPLAFALLAPLALSGVAAPALAQGGAPAQLGARVDRIERELRAVQRKVFPGSAQAPGYFEPEISAPAAPPQADGVPASAPIADLTARVNALESEIARLTGQVEQNGFKLRQMEEQVTRFRSDAEFRLNALEGKAPAGETGAAPSTRGETVFPASTEATDAAAPDAFAPAAAPPTEAPTASADSGEEAYLAGYRYWADKKYDQAETSLKAFLARYPQHRRASYGQNLLGRTYLDSGRPAAAAVALHKNFTANPRGDRAPDSLYFLGQALMRLDKPQPAKACEAYDALTREYGATISADLRAKVARARVDAKCAVE